MSDNNNEFNAGDLVRHRASMQNGVILNVNETCSNPDHDKAFGCLNRTDCQYTPSGQYTVSTGWGDIEEDVEGFLLELAPKHRGLQLMQGYYDGLPDDATNS